MSKWKRMLLSSFLVNLRYVGRFFHGVQLIVIVFSLGVQTFSYAWVDGTPYFFDRFPVVMEQPLLPAAPAQSNLPRHVVGDRQEFFSMDFGTNEQYTLSATLRAIGEFCYVFVEDSQWNRVVNGKTVDKVRRAFDDSTPAYPKRGIYQIETELFGNPPDVDGDDKIYLLLLDIRDSAVRGSGFVAGFFSPVDQHRGVLRHPELGVPIRSNERDLLYVDTDPLDAGGEEGLGVVAHELQHLIHWQHDRDEKVWVNEGCSDYAMFLCGYHPRGHVRHFENQPSVSLTDWPQASRSELAHYGAAYLWMLYLAEHYGGRATIATIVKDRKNGIAGISSALMSRGVMRSFSAIFADWKIANFVDDGGLADGRYGYQNQRLRLHSRRTHSSYPVKVEGNQLNSYAADYITLSANDKQEGLKVGFEADGKIPYNLKAIEFQRGRAFRVQDVPLTSSGRGNLISSLFGFEVEKIVLVPSVHPEGPFFFEGIVSSYKYRASLGDKVLFETSVLPNPVHPRYWDIIAVPSDQIGVNVPMITVFVGSTEIVFDQPMRSVQDGTKYTYPVYVGVGTKARDVTWRVAMFDRVVGQGQLIETDN